MGLSTGDIIFYCELYFIIAWYWKNSRDIDPIGCYGTDIRRLPWVAKNSPAMQETQRCNASVIPGSGKFLGGGNGNPLQKIAQKIPWTEEPGGLQTMGLQRVGHDWATKQQEQQYEVYRN